MKNIPHQRLLLYSLIGGLLPLFAAIVWFFGAKEEIRTLENNFELLQYQASNKEKKQAQNRSVQNYFADADHFYIDKHLETLSFLEPELDQLQLLLDGSLPVADSIRKRHEQLSGPLNALSFVEGQVHSFASFQETIESLAHPVEVNVQDLQKILTLIEGTEVGPYKPIESRPQLIITDFKLERKEVIPQHETYQLQLKLLKREYL